MHRRPTVRTLGFAAVVAAAALAAAAAAATAGASARRTPAGFTERAVTHAFNAQGIRLYDTDYGQPFPVKALSSVTAHNGWRLGVFIYRDAKRAKTSFDQNMKEWVASGMAVALARNVVVTVVPDGRSLLKKAKHLPMPKPVAAAIAAFAGT